MTPIFFSYDASRDVAALKVVDKCFPVEVLFSHSQTSACALHSIHRQAKEKAALAGLRKKLVGVSHGMLKKIAVSGLFFDYIQLGFKQNEAEGLKQLLKEKKCGWPQVTENREIFQAVVGVFAMK